MKEIQKVVNKNLRPAVAAPGYEPAQKHKVTPWYTGVT